MITVNRLANPSVLNGLHSNFQGPKTKNIANITPSVHNNYRKVPHWAFKGVAFMGNNDVTVKVGSINLETYREPAKAAVKDITERAGVKGQFLNWINVLPDNQIKQLDEIYELAGKAKTEGFTDIAILGIGGSRHTTEAMVKLLGIDSKVHFYSGIDDDSFERFAKTFDPKKTKFLVVSKSGGTLETTVAYENAKKLLEKELGTKDLSDRFIAMTDVSSEKSKLRQIVDSGEIKLSGLVHDDVGGRFSIFDDATLFTLAYVGVDKNVVKRMLQSSINAQKEFLNPNIQENMALQLATFNSISKVKGNNKHFVEYFGDAFSGATLWEKQLKNESLKAKISTDTNVGPGYLHYNAEADLDKNNRDSFFTFVYPKTNDLVTSAVVKGVINAYSAKHPVSQIEIKDYSPESIAKFFELKHFETLYTGNILRQLEGEVTDKSSALPEVLQPNVEIYKKEVKSELSK